MTDDFGSIPIDVEVDDTPAPSPELQKLMANPPKLAKLGFGAPVIQMADQGATVPEIAKAMALPETQVAEVVKATEVLPPEEKQQLQQQYQYNSVFALPDRMQELYDDTMRMSRLAEENPLLYKDYLNTRVTVLKLAKECMKDAAIEKQRDDEFNQMLDVINKSDDVTCPHCAKPFKANIMSKIIKGIQTLRANRGIIKGF